MPAVGTEKAPEISVVVAAWNASATLPRCAAAVRSQRDVSTELLIVDDASSDDTAAVAGRLAAEDPAVRLLRMERNAGPGGARNRAIDAARGDWVAVLDSDDTMTPDRLATMLALARRRQADVVLGNLTEVDAAGHRILFLKAPAAPVEWSLAEYVQGNLGVSGARSYGYLKPLLRRDFLERHEIRYDTRLRNGEDFHLVLAAYRSGGRVWYSPAPDYLYERRSGSISHRADPAHLDALLEAEERLLAEHWLPPDVDRLFRQRLQRFANLRASELFLAALRQRRPIRAASAIARRPSSAGLICRSLTEATGKRIRRHLSSG